MSCSRKQHTAAGVRTVYLCIQSRHSSQPTNMLFTRLSPPGTHFTAESTEAMQIKCLVQGHNILMSGFEQSTSVLRAPSGFDVKSFPRQSRSRGGGIATACKSTFGSNITFKTNFDFTHTSFEVVQASISLQHNTLHFFCLYRPPPTDETILLTLWLLNSYLTFSIT